MDGLHKCCGVKRYGNGPQGRNKYPLNHRSYILQEDILSMIKCKSRGLVLALKHDSNSNNHAVLDVVIKY